MCNNTQEVKDKYGVKTFYFKNPTQILKAILNCDILISGGGSLLQNKTSNFSLFYYLFVILLAKLFFKKVIIFAQGIEPIIGKFPEFITKTILKFVNFITVRDNNSKKLLKSWNINSTLVSDPAYSLVQDRKIEENKKGLIVQLRNYRGMNYEFISALALFIAQNCKEEVSVFSFQDEIDERICFEFIEELKKYNIKAQYIPNKSTEETIDIVNKAQYVISTRLHGLIISNALNTRTFAISYDEKIKTLINELNLESIDIFNYTKDELNTKLNKFFNYQSENIQQYRRFEWIEIDKELK